MKRAGSLLVLSLLLLALACGTASATPRPWIAATAGASTYQMGDLNDEIGAINSALTGSGLEMKEVRNGFVFGAAAGIDLPKGFAVGLGFDRLTGNSKIADPTGSIEYDVPANLIRAFGRYTFESAGPAGGFFEVSLGRVSSAGQIKLSAAGEGSATGDISGSGIAFEGGAGVELHATRQVGFVLNAGYRHASATDVEVEGQPIFALDGGRYALDYSGIFLRAGIAIRLIP